PGTTPTAGWSGITSPRNRATDEPSPSRSWARMVCCMRLVYRESRPFAPGEALLPARPDRSKLVLPESPLLPLPVVTPPVPTPPLADVPRFIDLVAAPLAWCLCC